MAKPRKPQRLKGELEVLFGLASANRNTSDSIGGEKLTKVNLSSHFRHRATALSDLELWQQVTRSVKPMHKTSLIASAGPIVPPKNQTVITPVSRKITATPSQPFSAIERETIKNLAKGKARIEQWIDLHGFDQEKAFHSLYKFIQNAYQSRLRIVLVITGKGSTGSGGYGVLRRLVPLWLASAAFRDMISGYSTAHPVHGGEGALYIRLRRSR